MKTSNKVEGMNSFVDMGTRPNSKSESARNAMQFILSKSNAIFISLNRKLKIVILLNKCLSKCNKTSNIK